MKKQANSERAIKKITPDRLSTGRLSDIDSISQIIIDIPRVATPAMI